MTVWPPAADASCASGRVGLLQPGQRVMRNNDTQAAGIACFGEILLRLYAPHGELLLQNNGFLTNVAGAEANVAVALSQWGHHAAVVSVLPDNALGRAAAGELRRY